MTCIGDRRSGLDPALQSDSWTSHFYQWGHSFQVYFKKRAKLAVPYSPFNSQSERMYCECICVHTHTFKWYVSGSRFIFGFASKTNTDLLQNEVSSCCRHKDLIFKHAIYCFPPQKNAWWSYRKLQSVLSNSWWFSSHLFCSIFSLIHCTYSNIFYYLRINSVFLLSASPARLYTWKNSNLCFVFWYIS